MYYHWLCTSGWRFSFSGVPIQSQSCLILLWPLDCNPPGSSVHRISQLRILEWVAISFSRSLPPHPCHPPEIEPVSPALAGRFFTTELLGKPCVWLFVTPWTAAYQALPPWDFPGKNTGVGCHFLLQEIFPTQGLNPGLPHCRFYRFTVWATRKSNKGLAVVIWSLSFSGYQDDAFNCHFGVFSSVSLLTFTSSDVWLVISWRLKLI